MILGKVVDNDVVKKTVYGKLITKINNIDISGFLFKTQYNKDYDVKTSDIETKYFPISNYDKFSGKILIKL